MIDRQGLAVLLLQQRQALGIEQICLVHGYTFRMMMNGIEEQALVLEKSSDYWQKRIHLQNHRHSLLVVWKHDSCVPLSVLALCNGRYYSPLASKEVAVRNRYTAQVLLGQLMCGIQSAYDRLEQADIHPSVKYRYLAKVHALSHRKRGRPLAS